MAPCHAQNLWIKGFVQTDLHEEVRRREDAQTDGEKDPALRTAPPVLVVHQLLTDLTVDLIPAGEEKKEMSSSLRCEQTRSPFLFSMPLFYFICLFFYRMSRLVKAYPIIMCSFSRDVRGRSRVWPSPTKRPSSSSRFSGWLGRTDENSYHTVQIMNQHRHKEKRTNIVSTSSGIAEGFLPPTPSFFLFFLRIFCSKLRHLFTCQWRYFIFILSFFLKNMFAFCSNLPGPVPPSCSASGLACEALHGRCWSITEIWCPWL